MHSVIPTRTPRRPGPLGTAALLGAVGLAASYLYVQAKRRSVENTQAPRGHFVEVDGLRLHYVERGKGPALVLLHGNGVLANDFDLSILQDHAARPYRVIAFDRPGFGHSARPGTLAWTPEQQAQLLYQALHQMGVERPILYGHGWGTLVALAMALRYPRYVRAIALASGAYYPERRARPAWLAAAALPGIGQLLRHTVAPLLGRLLWQRMARRIYAPRGVPQGFVQTSPWMALRPSQLGASAAETAMLDPAAERLSARYGELTLPIAIIAGAEDQIVSVDRHALRLHGQVQHSELVIDSYAGHMPHDADPGRVMGAIEGLEAQLTPGAAAVRH